MFQDVDARIFLRGDVARLGIAPLTSMYWFGKHNHYIAPDWRPEVHDSDGLELHLANGERIWRPLNNPPRPMANSFAAEGLIGFGLAQRERSFERYQDDGVFYEKRATLWVEPQGDWGAGSVMLVELPTNDEIHDNIVVFWVPAEPAKAGSELRPQLPAELGGGGARAAGGALHRHPHRGGRRARPAAAAERGQVRLRSRRARLPRPRPLERGRGGGRGEPRQARADGRLPDRHHRPLAGDVRPRHRARAAATTPIDLRMYVRHGGRAMSETWIAQAFPSQLRELLASHA